MNTRISSELQTSLCLWVITSQWVRLKDFLPGELLIPWQGSKEREREDKTDREVYGRVSLKSRQCRNPQACLGTCWGQLTNGNLSVFITVSITKLHWRQAKIVFRWHHRTIYPAACISAAQIYFPFLSWVASLQVNKKYCTSKPLF